MTIKHRLNLDDININAGMVVYNNGLYYVINEQTGKYLSNLVCSGKTWAVWRTYVFTDVKKANEADEKLNGEFRRKRIHDAYWGDLPSI